MKKSFLFLLSSLMVISLCSCSAYMEKLANKIVDGIKDDDSVITSDNTISSDKNNLSMAKWNGDVFVSEWAGFKMPLPSGWYKATDEEIKESNKLGAEAIAGALDEDTEKYSGLNAIYPLYVLKQKYGEQTTDINTSILIIFEKLGLLDNVAIKDSESYITYLKEQLESLEMGYVCQTPEQVQVAGETYTSVIATITEKNLRQQYLSRKYDDYIISLIVTGSLSDPDEMDDLLNCIVKNQ